MKMSPSRWLISLGLLALAASAQARSSRGGPSFSDSSRWSNGSRSSDHSSRNSGDASSRSRSSDRSSRGSGDSSSRSSDHPTFDHPEDPWAARPSSWRSP